jgi:uncharacterized protein
VSAKFLTDCHTHISANSHLSDDFMRQGNSAWGDLRLGRPLTEHWSAMSGAARAIVLGFRAAASGWEVPNDFVADYVREHGDRLVGFAGIDLADSNAAAEVDRAVGLGLRGLKIGPIYQSVHPLDPRAEPVYARAEALGLPIMWHQGATFVRQGPLEFAKPIDIDTVAIRHPELKIVIAHMGHPWIEEAIVVARKQPNVFMDVSGLHPRPWQLYNALRLAIEYRVIEKLLLGSDYPFFTLQETVAGLSAAASLANRVGLPPIPDETIETIVYRDGLALLGLAA